MTKTDEIKTDEIKTDETKTDDFKRFLYWIDAADFDGVRCRLAARGHPVRPARLTPCEVLRAREKEVLFAAPEVWSRMCSRQGSWYRASARQGAYMLMSAERLPEEFGRYLDAELQLSDFVPTELPSAQELEALVRSQEYRQGRPQGWENVKWWEAIFMKVFFTFTRAWGRGESLKRHWLGHRANHANFLARQHTTRIDGEDVAYSVTDNAGVCSSCVEFFNLLEPGARKLVRSCPGSISRGGAPRDAYVDVRPVAAASAQRPSAQRPRAQTPRAQTPRGSRTTAKR